MDKMDMKDTMDTFFMDRMDKLPNNLQLTIYNLHRLWAPAHAVRINYVDGLQAVKF